MLSQSIVVILGLLGVSHAYSTGMQKPFFAMDICVAGNLKPGHGSNVMNANLKEKRPWILSKETQGAPFALEVISNARYQPEIDVKVTLRALTPRKFKGFYIYIEGADAVGGDMGSWRADTNTNAEQGMFCVKGITHNDSLPKDTADVIWTPPANFTHGPIRFRATVVEDFHTFYTGIMSRDVEAVSTVETQTVYLERLKEELKNKFLSKTRQLMQSVKGQAMPSMTQMAGILNQAKSLLGGQGGAGVVQSMTQMAGILNQAKSLLGGQGGAGQNGGSNTPSFFNMDAIKGLLGGQSGAANGQTAGANQPSTQGMEALMNRMKGLMGGNQGGAGNAPAFDVLGSLPNLGNLGVLNTKPSGSQNNPTNGGSAGLKPQGALWGNLGPGFLGGQVPTANGGNPPPNNNPPSIVPPNPFSWNPPPQQQQPRWSWS